MSEILLQTKLYLPISRHHLVARPSLSARLQAGLAGRLTLVAAPAGFGKTTLIASWGKMLEQEGEWRFGWLSLDKNDNDLARFLTYFIAALQKIDDQLGAAAFEAVQSPQVEELEFILTRLVNDLVQFPGAIVLALDDYHLISNPDIHTWINLLIEHGPPNLHLLLLSRTEPPLPLARLRARRQMTEFRQADLRFTAAEVNQFLNTLMALDLPEQAVNALEKRTEGWIAGLQMAALSMQGRPDINHFISDFTGSHRYIFDYLTEEVLAGQPPEVRAFLLQTAVLDRLCAPLCDALLESTESQHLLDQLDTANLFLMPLDNERRWFRYHQLFSDLLRQQLRQEQPEQESILHGRASLWFEAEGYTDEAVQHALAADYERAARLVAKFSQSLVHRGEMSKLLSWINQLPLEWQRRDPELIFNHAWALLFQSSPQEVAETLAHMPEAMANSLPYSAYLLVLGCVEASRQGNAQEAIDLAEKAQGQLAALAPNQTAQSMEGVSSIILANEYRTRDSVRAAGYFQKAVSKSREAGNLIAFLTAVRDSGRFLLEQGQLHQAEAVFLEGVQSERYWARKLNGRDRKLMAAAPIHASLGQLYYEWNQLDKAEEHLLDALNLLEMVGPVNYSQGLAAAARLRIAQGHIEAVPALLSILEHVQEKATNSFSRRWAAIAIVETACSLYQAQPTAERRQALEYLLPALDREREGVLVQSRGLLALRRPAEALPLLEPLANKMRENGLDGLWLSTILLQSLAKHQAGQTDKAVQELGQALAIAQPAGYVRLFLDEGQEMAELLRMAVHQKIEPAYASQLLALFPNVQTPFPSPEPDPGSLSPREVEVLRLVARGLTNKEIAAALVIAPSTAKRHTVNIYNKLGVSNRAEASVKAYEIGVINLP